MFTSISFYIGEKVLGLNDREYPLGELTAEVLNISPEEYQELQQMLDKALDSVDRYEDDHQMRDWFHANEEMIQLHDALCCHRIFRLIQDRPEVLYETRTLTEQYSLFPEEDFVLGERDKDILISCFQSQSIRHIWTTQRSTAGSSSQERVSRPSRRSRRKRPEPC